MILEPCIHCDLGTVEVQPFLDQPWRTVPETCPECDGKVLVPILCESCLDEPAEVRVRSHLLCAACYREDYPREAKAGAMTNFRQTGNHAGATRPTSPPVRTGATGGPISER